MRTLAVTKVTLFGTFFLFWFEEVDCNNGDGESSHTSVWGDIRPPRGNTELAKNTRENIKFQEAYARYFIIPHLSEVLKNVCKRLFCGLKPPTRARLVLFQTGAETDDAEMKHELCNFLPRPDPGAGCGQDTLAGPAARPTFTTTIWLPSSLPCTPPRGPCPDPMQGSLQTSVLQTAVCTRWVRNRLELGPDIEQYKSCFVGAPLGAFHLVSVPGCQDEIEARRGEWSKPAPASHKLQVHWTAAPPHFATISRMQFEAFFIVFISAKKLAGPLL